MRRRVIIWALWAALLALGHGQEPAKPQEAPAEARELQELLRALGAAVDIEHLFRFDRPWPEECKEPIFHQPETMGFAIERDLAKLPKSGNARRMPWPGYWWPMSQNGTARAPRGGASPLAKYAQAFGLGAEVEAWERQRHGCDGGSAPRAWFGHCNGWAAAATMEPEPEEPVTVNGVTFAPSDIKALLTEVYFGCRALGVDERYDGAETLATDAYGRPKDRAYRDVNPGVLHLLVANLIGREGRAVVADISAGPEVWNHPVSGFTVTALTELADAAAALRAICGRSGATYPFNREAKRWFDVSLELRYTDAFQEPKPPVGARAARHQSSMKLGYVLETDAAGKILGGEWTGDSRTRHPDFVWVPLTPSSSFTVTPDGRLVVGTSGNSNPHVVYEEVAKLLEKSVGGNAARRVASVARTSHGPGRWDRPGATPAPHTIRRLQVANRLVRAGQGDQAVRSLTAALEELPPEDFAMRQEILVRRGWLRCVQGNVAQGLEDYERVNPEGEFGPTVRARRSLMLTLSGDTVSGLLVAARAIEMNPKNPWGYCARGWVYRVRRAEHDLERAQVEFDRARSLGADPFLEFCGQVGRASRPAQAQGAESVPAQIPERLLLPLQRLAQEKNLSGAPGEKK